MCLSGLYREWDLFRGPLETLKFNFFVTGEEFYQSANLAWPDDRSWCLAADIGLNSTYVGGPEALIGELLGRKDLEAYEAFAGDRLWEDRENPWMQEQELRLGLICNHDAMLRVPLWVRIAGAAYRLVSRVRGRRETDGTYTPGT